MCRSTGMSGMPKDIMSTTEAVLTPTPSMPVSQSRAASGSISPRNSSEWSPLASRSRCSEAWMRGAFCGASPPGRMTSMSSSTGAASTATQSGAAAWTRPLPPQPGRFARSAAPDPSPAAPRQRAGLCAGSAGRVPIGRPARIGRPQGLEGLLRVRVGRVLGEDGEHQLGGRIVDALPGRLPVAGVHLRRARTSTRPGRPRRRRRAQGLMGSALRRRLAADQRLRARGPGRRVLDRRTAPCPGR